MRRKGGKMSVFFSKVRVQAGLRMSQGVVLIG